MTDVAFQSTFKPGDRVVTVSGCPLYQAGVVEAVVTTVHETLGDWLARRGREIGGDKRVLRRMVDVAPGGLRELTVGIKVYGHNRLPEGCEICAEAKFLRPAPQATN